MERASPLEDHLKWFVCYIWQKIEIEKYYKEQKTVILFIYFQKKKKKLEFGAQNLHTVKFEF